MVYLDLLGQAVKSHGVGVVGYCVMSNHVHVVVILHQAQAFAETFKQVQGRYASYWNVAHAGSVHLWHRQECLCHQYRGASIPAPSRSEKTHAGCLHRTHQIYRRHGITGCRG
jgi:REP element-mobilizing transposase RayT